jgi:hypothetical protein
MKKIISNKRFSTVLAYILKRELKSKTHRDFWNKKWHEVKNNYDTYVFCETIDCN